MRTSKLFSLLWRPVLGMAVVVLLSASPAQISAQQPYHIVDHWKLGGDGGWDYLLAEPGAHRLYITHGPRVEVIDSQTGKPVGAITGLHGTHGVALDTSGKFGYISDGGGNGLRGDRGHRLVVQAQRRTQRDLYHRDRPATHALPSGWFDRADQYG